MALAVFRLMSSSNWVGCSTGRSARFAPLRILSTKIAARRDEALRLQSRVMDLTEQVYEGAGMSPGDRTLRGKVTGLFFGLQAHLEELNRLAQDDA
jgi:hypothetical protein